MIQPSNYLFIKRSVHSFTHLSIHPFNHLYIHPPTYPSSHSSIIKLYLPSIDLPIQETILRSVNPKFHPFIQTPIHLFNLDLPISLSIYTLHPLHDSTNRFMYISIRRYVQTSTHPTHPLMHSFIQPSIQPSISPSAHPSIHLSHLAIHPSSISTKT